MNTAAIIIILILLIILGLIIYRCLYIFCIIKNEQAWDDASIRLEQQKLEQEQNEKLMQTQFKNILEFADLVIERAEEYKCIHSIANYEEHPILGVIKILGRYTQSQYMAQLLYDPNSGMKNNNIKRIKPKSLFFDEDIIISKAGLKFNDIIKSMEPIQLPLSNLLILPCPWDRDRLVNTIASIGEGLIKGKWKQDSNHSVILWHPIRIAWVSGGNHSITTGITQEAGRITPNAVFDISEIYQYVYCDGLYFRKKDDDSKISSVKSLEFAAIFEIGRKIVEKNIL